MAGLSNENMRPPTATHYSFSLKLKLNNSKVRIKYELNRRSLILFLKIACLEVLS